jgi:hypothetical protein
MISTTRSLAWVGIREGLTDLAVEHLGYIVDGVRHRCAGAPADAVARELRTFQRVRQLAPAVVQRLAEAIAGDALHHTII